MKVEVPISRSLENAIDFFLEHREANVRPKTYEQEVVIMRTFLRLNKNMLVSQLDYRHFDTHMKNAAIHRPRSNRADYRVLKCFSEFVRDELRWRKKDFDPMRKRKMPPLPPRKEYARIDAEQFPALIQAGENIHPQYGAFIAANLFLLRRGSETAQLRVGVVNMERETIVTDSKKTNAGENERLLGEQYKYYLVRWFKYYADRMVEQGLITYANQLRPWESLHPAWFLVPAKWGHQGRQNTVSGKFDSADHGVLRPQNAVTRPDRLVKPALEAIGWQMKDPITDKSNWNGAHTLRRSAARALYDAWIADGVVDPLPGIMQALDHTDRQRTLEYIGLEPGRAQLNHQLAKGPQFRFKMPVDQEGTVSQIRAV